MTFDSTTLVLIGVVIAGLALILVGLLVTRRQRLERSADPAEGSAGPYVANRDRPYLQPARREGSGVADEVAHATTDVAGEVLGVAVSRGAAGPKDDLQRLKGVGPKFAARLSELGITRFDQLAGLNANEAAHLDERLGPFQGRLASDRIVEQADYLARGDTDGFEERFGKLS